MARYKKQRQGKNDANTRKVPQEVAKDKSSLNVIWNGIVIDYESMYTYPLTEESLRQVCGTNTTFQKVTSGYGLFPPKNLRNKVNKLKVTDWGLAEYFNTEDSSIRGYFL